MCLCLYQYAFWGCGGHCGNADPGGAVPCHRTAFFPAHAVCLCIFLRFWSGIGSMYRVFSGYPASVLGLYQCLDVYDPDHLSGGGSAFQRAWDHNEVKPDVLLHP